jgi:tetratricopeptide (TPR) repeat protein
MRRTWAIGAVLTLICSAPFVPLLWADFVNFDDDSYVTDNPRVRAGLSAASIAWAMTSFEHSNWHPLTWLSLMVDATVWGDRAWGYHLTNLLLHLGSTLVLWRLLARWLSAPVAACAAALWAIHPLRVESVAWVSERKDVLSMLFGLLAIRAYAGTSGRAMWRTAGWMAMSLMSKPTFVTLPAVLLLLDHWPLGRWGDRRAGPAWQACGTAWKLVVEKWPLVLLSVAGCIVAYQAQQVSGSVSDWLAVPLSQRVDNAIVSYGRYLMRLVRLHDLAVIYPLERWPAWVVGANAAGLLIATAWAMWRVRSRPWLAVGWCWFLGTMVPMIGLVQVGSQSMADRYMHLPMIGLVLAAGASIPSSWMADRHRRRALGAAAGLVAAVFAAFTFVQCGYWRDSLTLFARAAQVTDRNAAALTNLGNALVEAGRAPESLEHYRRAHAADPRSFHALYNHANALLATGDDSGAIERYELALRLKPQDLAATTNLAIALARVGRPAEAIELHRLMLSRYPDQTENLFALANVLAELRRWPEAIETYRRLLAIRPDHRGAAENLQQVLQHQTQEGTRPPPP